MNDRKPLIWHFPEPINKKNLSIDEKLIREVEGNPHNNMCSYCHKCSDNKLSNEEESLLNPFYMANYAIKRIESRQKNKIKAIWIEASGCFGEIISLLNGSDPDIFYWLTQMVDLKFFGSIMADQGELAYQQIVDTVNSGEEYILAVCGAIPLAQEGNCAILASYKGKLITVAEAVRFAASNAKEVICMGSCASYGGITAAKPNISNAVDVGQFLNKSVIRAPGCPCNPVWMLGIFAYIVNFGHPPTDQEGRPTDFYGKTIHDHCPRRSFYDNFSMATKFGQQECMYMLGCRGPVTKALCPFTKWGNSENWPIGCNTTCIGCANKGFPDLMEPFVTYKE